MKKTIIYSILIAVLFIAGCTPATPSNEQKPILKIGYLPITHAGPLFLGDYLNDGQYDGYQVELVKFGSWPDLMDALNTGNIDGASVLAELAMKSQELGTDLKAVALGHTDGNVLISSKEIEETADLKGKTYAIPHKFSSHNILLNEMLKKDGMTYEDVNVVEMAPAEMPAALSENRIAGYVVAEPFGAMAVAMDKGKVHYHSEEIWPHSYCCILVMRKDFIDKNLEIVQSFVQEYAALGKKANEKDDEVYDAFSQFMKVDREVLELSLEWISYDELRVEEKEYNKLSDFMIEMGISENPPAYNDFVDNSFIDGAS